MKWTSAGVTRPMSGDLRSLLQTPAHFWAGQLGSGGHPAETRPAETSSALPGLGEVNGLEDKDLLVLVLLGHGESHNYACEKYGCCKGKQHVT